MQAGETARGREQAITQNMKLAGWPEAEWKRPFEDKASQESTNRLADVSAQQAQADALSRIQATQSAMQGGAALRAGDVNLNQTNANILNQFAMTNAERQMQVANMNTQQRNAYLNQQQQTAQQLANLNTQGANQAQLQNNAYTAAERQSGNQNLLTQYSAQQNALDNYYMPMQHSNLGWPQENLAIYQIFKGMALKKKVTLQCHGLRGQTP